MPRVLALALGAALAVSTLPARADDGTAEFMKRFSGAWIGSGHFLVGTDTGLEFACTLDGDPDGAKLTFDMRGTCRMGTLSAPINAKLRYNADTRQFYGDFMGGAEGDGVDLIGARAGQGFSLKLVRGSTQGRLAASTVGKNEMKVTIYLKDPKSTAEMPVVAMGFTRKEVITGSIEP
jgi:hypothetical protein